MQITAAEGPHLAVGSVWATLVSAALLAAGSSAHTLMS